ncbi:hypothetical protein PWT90_03832 [Aphanocladium album]|nr:hypothetical protein PWT90_03832 [Aphanocladium album]
MKNSFFNQTAPTEVIVLILHQADSASDAVALGSACQRTNSIWQRHSASILWSVKCRQIPGFDDALIASRLTKRVADAQAGGDRLPTDVAPADWSGFRRRPSVCEIKVACDFVHFSKAMQIAIFHMKDISGHIRDIGLGQHGAKLPEKPERMAEWQARVSKAIYRSLIIGASLAGYYTQPFFEASTEGSATEISGESVSDILCKFTVYNCASDPSNEERVFGKLGEWLVEGIMSEEQERADFEDRFAKNYGRGDYCGPTEERLEECVLQLSNITSPLKMSHADAHLVVWKLAQVLFVCENLSRLIKWPSSQSHASSPEGVAEVCDCEQNRTLLAVIFNIFQAEEVCFPKTLSWAERPIIAVHSSNVPEADTWTKLQSPYGDCAETLWRLQHECPYIVDDDELGQGRVPCFEIKWFEFCVRHYFKLGFDPGVFHLHDAHDPYENFIRSITIFAADDLEGRSSSRPDQQDVVGCEYILNGAELLVKHDSFPARRRLF